MSNNTFNTAEFFGSNTTYYPPIALGEHTVKIGKAKAVIEFDELGKDISYLLLPMVFENDRKIDNRFYNVGVKIACDQIRQQLGDETVYKNIQTFLKTLEGKELTVYISRCEYLAKDGTSRTKLQYDFVPPAVATEDTDENDPF
jgi:hypothetical protein